MMTHLQSFAGFVNDSFNCAGVNESENKIVKCATSYRTFFDGFDIRERQNVDEYFRNIHENES